MKSFCLAFLYVASYLCDRHIKTIDGTTQKEGSSVRTQLEKEGFYVRTQLEKERS